MFRNTGRRGSQSKNMSTLEKFTHTLHEYERSKSNKEIYRCVHPDCHHYKRREFLLGKRAQCFKCKSSFILTRLQLNNFHPVCEYCTKSPRAKKNLIVLKIAEELIGTSGDLKDLGFIVE